MAGRQLRDWNGIFIYVNSAAVAGRQANATTLDLAVATVIKLNEGDVVRMTLWTNQSISVEAAARSHLSLVRVSGS